jgi:putative oxidoreductase
MKKLLSVKYNATSFNISFLLLRLLMGVTLAVNHGYPKLIHYAEKKDSFVNLWGLGSNTTLALVVFAEFFCSVFIVLGLFTRFTVLPLILTMGYAFIVSHNGMLFDDGEHAALYLSGFTAILLCGPGRVSVDGLINK